MVSSYGGGLGFLPPGLGYPFILQPLQTKVRDIVLHLLIGQIRIPLKVSTRTIQKIFFTRYGGHHEES
jgi:hypothetical protein